MSKNKKRKNGMVASADVRADPKPEAEVQAAKSAQMNASGYGNHGANTTKNSMLGWMSGGGSAEDDIDLNGSTLRKRARDLYAGGGLGRAAPAKLVTSVVGWGLIPKPKLDGDTLGMSDEACTAWERRASREFALWAESRMCDAARQKNFYALQELAYRSQLISGDVFVLFGNKPNRTNPYTLTLRLIEADRVSTPDSSGDSEVKEDGNRRIIDGVEVDADGEVIRYHIASRHPLASEDSRELTWTAIDAFGKDTGLPNVLHLADWERPEQRRGIPFISGMIEQIKQLDRYINSEQAANIISSMLTVFLTSERDDGMFPLPDTVDEEERVTDSAIKAELNPGAIIHLPPGVKPETIDPHRNPTAFQEFVKCIVTMIGAGNEIPAEVLLSSYNSNYTASRAARLDYWALVRRSRTRFTHAFCQPVYEQWLAEAVAMGRIEAPGFFDDAGIRKAWCGCMWIGASQGHVNPVQEANAAKTRVEMGMSTVEQEAAEYSGNDWDTMLAQRKKEIAAMNSDNYLSTDNGRKEKKNGE